MENNCSKKIVISKPASGDYFFGFFPDKNPTKKFDFLIEENAHINLFFYIFSEEKNQNYQINLHHKNNAKSNCSVNLFATNDSKVELQINSFVAENTTNIQSHQRIEGVLFSSTAVISVVPSMFVKSNKSLTTHSVNIGQIDPEKTFYLETRGLSTQEAKKTLLVSLFSELSMAKSKEVKCLYNKVMEKFNAFVK